MKRTIFILLLCALSLVLLLYLTKKSIPETPSIQSGIDAKKYGSECEYAGECGDIVGINCNSEVDGPFYYVSKSSGAILEYCGGHCDVVPNEKYCKNCPPKEWICN